MEKMKIIAVVFSILLLLKIFVCGIHHASSWSRALKPNVHITGIKLFHWIFKFLLHHSIVAICQTNSLSCPSYSECFLCLNYIKFFVRDHLYVIFLLERIFLYKIIIIFWRYYRYFRFHNLKLLKLVKYC